MKHIKDLKIVITAGASGIGSEIAQVLLKAHANVVICDKDQEALDRFSKNNPEIVTIKADVSNEEEVLSLFTTVKEHFGEINALINNAGIAGPSAKLEDTDFKDKVYPTNNKKKTLHDLINNSIYNNTTR